MHDDDADVGVTTSRERTGKNGGAQRTRKLPKLPKNKQKGFSIVLDAMAALRREDKEIIWSSMIKQTAKRKQPSFNETAYGYSNFSELVEDGARMGLFKISKDERSGSYIMSEIDSSDRR